MEPHQDDDNEMIDLGEMGRWSKATIRAHCEYAPHASRVRQPGLHVPMILNRKLEILKRLYKEADIAENHMTIRISWKARILGRVTAIDMVNARDEITNSANQLKEIAERTKKLNRDYDRLDTLLNPSYPRTTMRQQITDEVDEIFYNNKQK